MAVIESADGAEPGFAGHLPVTHSVISGEAVIEVVSRCYALPPIERCYLLRRGFNDVYRIDLANGTSLVARLSALRHRGPANTNFEVSMLEQLATEGVAVGVPVRPISGLASVGVKLPEGIRQLALFSFLTGKSPDTADDMKLTGTGLAAIHQAATGYTGPDSRFRIGSHYLVDQPLARILEAPWLETPLHDGFTERFTALSSALREREPSLTQSFCHGDCHGGNNLVWTNDAGERCTAFFDFDDAAPGFKSYDLAVFLWSQLIGEWPVPEVSTLDDWQHFLSGYESVGTLGDTDRAAIPLFVCARHAWFIGEFTARASQWGSQALSSRWLHKQLEALDAWLTLPGFEQQV